MRRLLTIVLVGACLHAPSPAVRAQYGYPPPPYGYPAQYVPPSPYYQPRPGMAPRVAAAAPKEQFHPSQFLPPPPTPISEPPTVPPTVESAPVTQVPVESSVVIAQSEPPTTNLTPVAIVDTRKRPGLNAGASFYLLKPYFSSNTAYTTRTGITTTSPADQSTDFSWEYRSALSFWIGWTNPDGLGLRGSFFTLDAPSIPGNTSLTAAQGVSTNVRPPASLVDVAGSNFKFGSPGVVLGRGFGQDNVTFSSNLAVHFIDVEATKAMLWSDAALTFSGGGRYLRINQDYRATLINNTSAATESQSLTFTHTFEGAGPTIAAELFYPLGIVRGLSLFGSCRGSLLLGRFTQSANFSQVVNDPTNIAGGTSSVSAASSSARESVLPITELECGVEYTTRIGRFQPLLRAGVVNHTYFNAGSASQTDGNLSLFGARFSWGLIY